ncbi:penicillin-binding transpeptidase domain-containing protein [Hallella bergensis]|uniref:penicillin-binding transpeptidase domain-containing protein n=1 Tax=Hallella bergensis TaxID=242750 RepID=UPI003990CA51
MFRLKTLIAGLIAACPVMALDLPTDGPLTIDPKLQALGERLLQGKQGSIVAIEPATGRILALVSQDKVNDGVNRAISTDYSPGSTFKVAQALEMLSEGALMPETTYPCRRGFTHDGIRIGCHPHKSPLALVQAISQSCNAYFCKAFQEMLDNRSLYVSKHRAINRWNAYMQSMGLGRTLGVDLPDEVSGVMPDSAFLAAKHGSWNGTTVMWMGMGQGEVRTTPLQLCNLAAVIANRGFYLTPHIHESAARLAIAEQDTTKHHSLATPEAFDIVVRGMRAATVNGTAASLNNPDYEICGKTGTAENEGEDHSIFMGFAPMEKPRIAVSVYVENGGFGADLAAPLAALMMEQHINGRLSQKSERRAAKWENRKVKITPVKVEINFDDL